MGLFAGDGGRLLFCAKSDEKWLKIAQNIEYLEFENLLLITHKLQ